MSAIDALCARQSGVISRSQLRDLAVPPTEIRRLLRRERLVMVSPGVYVNHTGQLTWTQSA